MSLIWSIYYAILGLEKAFREEYIIQDDARQYLFWMAKFQDSELFNNDLIADYFQSVTPKGFSSLYYVISQLGIEPILFHKILPLILGIITTGYCFFVCLKFFNIPLAGFITTILLNQSLWRQDDLVSATPRAFIYPLFLAFLYYLIEQKLLPCLIVIILQGLFYPQTVLIYGGIFLLQLITQKNYYKLPLFGLITAGLILGYYALNSSSFSPVITVEQAKNLPELLENGRSAFFYKNSLFFWFFAERSGLIPALLPPLIWFGLFFPLVQKLSPIKVNNLAIIQQIILASVGLFFLAHLLLFKLHLPSRYTDHSFRIVMALLSGITITILLNHGWLLFKKSAQYFHLIWTGLLIIFLLFYPHLDRNFPLTNYRIGGQTELYQFLQQQPKDIMIASLSSEMNNIPTFAQRSVLVAPEYAIPYHWGYYSQFRQRLIDLVEAQYSADLTKFKMIHDRDKVNLLIIEKNAFSGEYLSKNPWLKDLPPTQDIVTQLNQGFTPAIVTKIPQCSIFEYNNLIGIKLDCLFNGF
jgi:hypothetical protein